MLQSTLILEPENGSFRIKVEATATVSIRFPFQKDNKVNVQNVDKAIRMLKQSVNVKDLAWPDLHCLRTFHVYLQLTNKEMYEKFSYISSSKDFKQTYLNNMDYLERRLAFVKTKYEKQVYINRIKDLQKVYLIYLDYQHL